MNSQEFTQRPLKPGEAPSPCLHWIDSDFYFYFYFILFYFILFYFILFYFIFLVFIFDRERGREERRERGTEDPKQALLLTRVCMMWAGLELTNPEIMT